jgi:hypothetical protein
MLKRLVYDLKRPVRKHKPRSYHGMLIIHLRDTCIFNNIIYIEYVSAAVIIIYDT